MSYIDQKRVEFGYALQGIYSDKRYEATATREDLETYAEKQLEILEACKRRVRPSPDILGVERSACELCPTLCEGYEPFEVFLLETHERAYSNTFIPTLCRNCKCPAYYHAPIIRPLKFPRVLLEGIRKYQLSETHLNFNGIIAIFSIDYRLLQNTGNSLKSYEDELFLLVQEGGFRVISRAVRVLSNHETEVLDSQLTIPKNKALLNVLRKKLTVQVPNLVKKKSASIELKNDEASLMLCLSATSYIDAQVQYNKFMEAAKQYIPQAFIMRYASRNSTQALTDTIIFFPEVFTAKRCCTILAPEPQQTSEDIQEDPIMSFFRKQSLRMRGDDGRIEDKDVNKMNIGKLIDMMNYNGFQPVGPVTKAISNQDEFLRILERILDDRRSVSFLKFLLSGCKDPHLLALAGTKVGINFLLTVNPNSFETFSFYSNRDTSALFSYFLPELSTSNRTVIIFRPVTVKSGLNKIFLDIFKINYFIIVKETFKVLSAQEVEFLARNIQFSPQGKQDFLELMMEGESHIVVLSKFGALNDAITICNGSIFGRKRIEKNLLGVKTLYIEHEKEYLDPFKIKLDEESGHAEYIESVTHKEEVKTIRNSGENVLFSLNPFSSFNELLDLDSVIESTISKSEHPSDEPNLYKRQAALDELREFSRSFNIVVHCSPDSKSAEEEIGRFFPKLLEYQDILLMLRLDAQKLKTQAIELLHNMGLKIINTWQHDRETWFHVVNQGARDEVIGVMHYNCLITEPLGPQHLSSVFEFCETPAIQQRRLDEMAPYISRFSGESLLLTKDAELEKSINYMVMATTGESCKQGSMQIFWANPDMEDVVFTAENEKAQIVEVRVRRVHTTARRDHLEDRLSLTNEFEGIKLYYMHASKLYKRLVPFFFKYRLEPNELEHEVTRIFNVEQHMGEIFLSVIAKSMSETRYLEHPKDTRRTATQESRGSTAAFMWGRKLAIAIKKLEEVKAEEIEDCGLLYWNGREMVGAMDDVHFHELEIQKYQKCLGDIIHVWSRYLTTEECREIQATLQIILKSQAFRATRDLKQVSLVPEYLDFKNLRIHTYKRIAKEVAEEGGKAFKGVGLDKNKAALAELKGDASKELIIQDFAIVNIQPSKYSKRHLAANICWMLSIYLKKLDRRLEVTENNVEEYDVLVDSILQGFLKNYNGDEVIEGYSCLKIEIFLFHLYEAWKTLLILDDLQLRIDNAQAEFDRKKYIRELAFELEPLRTIITSLIHERERWEYDFVMQLESLARLDITAEDVDGSNKYLSIPHNRYFKFYGMEEYEPKLDHPKYPNILLQEKFPIIAEKLTSGGQFEKNWFNPPRLPRFNLREVPDSAWRFTSTNVPATKWVTQERLKKIVKSAVLQLLNTGINRKR
jgi:hypothetical protein